MKILVGTILVLSVIACSLCVVCGYQDSVKIVVEN